MTHLSYRKSTDTFGTGNLFMGRRVEFWETPKVCRFCGYMKSIYLKSLKYYCFFMEAKL